MKRSERLWLLYTAVFVIIAAISYGLYRYTAGLDSGKDGQIVIEPPDIDQPDDEPAVDDPKIVFEGGEWSRRDAEGNLLWRVTAEGEIKYEEDQQRLAGSGIAFEVHRQGEPTVRLEAPRFVADYEGRQLVFSEGVRGELIGARGHFAVNRIVYQAQNRKLVGEGGAEFDYGGYSARADRLVIDVKNQKTRLQGDVVLSGRSE